MGEILLEKGRNYARLGQSVRAEQYLLAALRQGAEPRLVYPTLVETCVQSGRLQSALVHVQAAIALSPTDARLRQLAASLYLALGQQEQAGFEAARLAESVGSSDQTLYFLGDFYEFGKKDDRTAEAYYRKYLARLPEGSEAYWARSGILRIEHRRQALAPASDEEASHE